VVELTVAIHYVFNTPDDRLIWDVGHQAYPHKIITGRRARLETIRRLHGLAPFCLRAESEYDAFGVGHSSTSISAAAGMAAAARILNERRRVVAVIGDGGMTAGMAYEALNHAGHDELDMLVVYNDNDMSISENVGALRNHSARILKALGMVAPHDARPGLDRTPNEAHLDSPGAIFRNLGFGYHGPVDGHDLDALMAAFELLRDTPGPQLLHVITVKGKGFDPAEADPIKYHGVTQFDPVTGAFAPKMPDAEPTFTQVFGNWLCEAAERDPRVVAITPAMREGSGLVAYAQRYPSRYFDVGIAEQHALTFAAGLASSGLKPVVAIYSTFLQRAYDQLIHDIALQNLPVVLAIDRAGLVGEDGATHAGAFDLSFLRCIPNLTIMAPADEQECWQMLSTAYRLGTPAAVRYPRGKGPGAVLPEQLDVLPVGKAQLLREGKDIAILAFDSMVQPALMAAERMDATAVNMRFVKPMDRELVLMLAKTHAALVTVEENAVMGGAGSAVSELLREAGEAIPVRHLGLPDAFVDHGEHRAQLALCNLHVEGILEAARTVRQQGPA
jgi:1-deoxy-D-xylulose-5-phosphate synthase